MSALESIALPPNRRLFAANCSLCDRDTGYSTITDVRGQAHLVFISRTRDGGVWLRLGVDQKSSQWASKSEYRQQLQDTLLSDRDMNVIENMNFSSACVVTDLRLEIRMEFGWHPSFVRTFDVATRSSEVLIFNRNRQCALNTTLRLTNSKQGLRCSGGDENSCGQHSLPYSGQASGTTFLELVTLDPAAETSMMCPQPGSVNSYTFHGSYYYAYIKMDSCPPPQGESINRSNARNFRFDFNCPL